ncbi:hypothetical protein F511_02505 [Dorcoceras hygrometricum]|nr:hypothetical protein F511_02505 [Dorcoceras hygrometricum]
MGFSRRLLVSLLLLFFLLASSSTGVPASRKLKSVKHETLVPSNYQYQDWIKDSGNSGGSLRMEGLSERRMNIELTDYPETGPNNNHDPRPPGRV